MEIINKECPICQEIPASGQIIFTCNHLMCLKCFIQYIKNYNNCPLCRKIFTEKSPNINSFNSRHNSRRTNTPINVQYPIRNNSHHINIQPPRTHDTLSNEDEDENALLEHMFDDITEEDFVNPARNIVSSIRELGDGFVNVFFRTIVESIINAPPMYPELRNAPPLHARRYLRETTDIDNNFCNKNIFWIGVTLDILLMVGYVVWKNN